MKLTIHLTASSAWSSVRNIFLISGPLRLGKNWAPERATKRNKAQNTIFLKINWISVTISKLGIRSIYLHLGYSRDARWAKRLIRPVLYMDRDLFCQHHLLTMSINNTVWRNYQQHCSKTKVWKTTHNNDESVSPSFFLIKIILIRWKIKLKCYYARKEDETPNLSLFRWIKI